MQYGNEKKSKTKKTKSMFKSYYVVWKPEGMQQAEAAQKSLNRTMQYGNR